ncbi:hypothetical protein [Campylobacter sp. MG1]|uniref:hypothetical protein n=1 Tax=Campylobacter sp. MG1 TaxID=2976332 RepID=UPI00226CEC99|nr:hypothetical protein [Campylobacter sp. MG1]
MNRYLKRIIIGAFVVPFVCFSCAIGFIYFYDPLQLFREKYSNRYIEDINISFKRVLGNYDFNGVVLGTSMSIENNPKELNFAKFINASQWAIRFNYRTNLLNYILKYKNINYVIFDLAHIKDDFNSEYYNIVSMYGSDNIYSKFMIYENNKTFLKCIMSFFEIDTCFGKEHDFYSHVKMINEYIKNDYEVNEKDFISNQNNYYDDSQIFINYFSAILNTYKDVYFIFIIPPKSILALKSKDINKEVEVYKDIILFLSKYDNTQIHFFGNEQFVDNINNYYDLYHYKPWINSRINKSINEGINIITTKNMDEYFDKFIKKIKNYDIKAYEEALKLNIKE